MEKRKKMQKLKRHSRIRKYFAKAKPAEKEVISVPEFSGAPEQLWRIDQLIDGTYRIMPKEVPGTDEQLALISIADSTPTLGKFDFNRDNSKWFFKTTK